MDGSPGFPGFDRTPSRCGGTTSTGRPQPRSGPPDRPSDPRGAELVTADSRDLADATIRLGQRATRCGSCNSASTRALLPGPSPGRTALAPRAPGSSASCLPARRSRRCTGHELLIRALQGLPDDVTAVFVRFSADPDTVAALEAEAARLGVGDRVRFLAAIPHTEMPEYLRLADVVLSMPTSDGTPVTILEAMAVGRPVVVTDLPSLREWLADIDPLALVPSGDVDSLVAAIRTDARSRSGRDRGNRGDGSSEGRREGRRGRQSPPGRVAIRGDGFPWTTRVNGPSTARRSSCPHEELPTAVLMVVLLLPSSRRRPGASRDGSRPLPAEARLAARRAHDAQCGPSPSR